MCRWISLIMTACVLLALLTVPALAQSGRERRVDPHPAEAAWPVIAHDWYYEGSFLFELTVAYDGMWYYLTGTITNVGQEPAGLTCGTTNALPYFLVSLADEQVWSTRRSGLVCQACVSIELEPGESEHYEVVWKGQDKHGYPVPPGLVSIEFVQQHFGWSGTEIVCGAVPVLRPDLRGYVATDSWAAQALDAFIADGVLPGYPPGYFTSGMRRWREMAMAAALLLGPGIVGSLSNEQFASARELAHYSGV